MRIYVRQCHAGGFFCALLGPAATDAGAGSGSGGHPVATTESLLLLVAPGVLAKVKGHEHAKDHGAGQGCDEAPV